MEKWGRAAQYRGAGIRQTAKMGAEQQRGSMRTTPQPKRKAVWRLKAQTEYALESCRVDQCERNPKLPTEAERQSGAMQTTPQTKTESRRGRVE